MTLKQLVVNRPSVQAVIYDEVNEKFLIIGKRHFRTGNIIWRLVKGGIEEGETDTQALKREISEEVGLKKVNVGDKVHYYEYMYEFEKLKMKHMVYSYFVKADINEGVTLQGESADEMPIVKYAWLSYYDTLKKLFWKNEKQSVKNSVMYL